MTTRLLSLCIIAIASVLSAGAAQPVVANRQTAGNYYAYPYPEKPLPVLTPAPGGYEPYHMEHYGRHGSRWHIGEWVYREPINLLRSAERNGKLTPRGKELLAQMRKIEMDSRGRDGELTQLGAVQHRGIARRMTANFPEIFGADARIDARSTDVVRCILSMDNELQEFKAFNPRLEVTSDGSKSAVCYLNFHDNVAAGKYEAVKKKSLESIAGATRPDYAAFASQLVDDPVFVADSIDAKALFESMFRIAANAQSHYDQVAPYDLFTDSQLHNKWVYDNADWFLRFGNTALTEGAGPMTQRYLLRNWIESADTAVMNARPSANMRFGHEVALLPFVVLLDLDGLGREINDLSRLENEWRNYEIFPMASNIQMIFYRPTGREYTPGDVLVKVLLNEREVTLPATPVDGPYYRWSDLRDLYLSRLGSDGGKLPEQHPYY